MRDTVRRVCVRVDAQVAVATVREMLARLDDNNDGTLQFADVEAHIRANPEVSDVAAR